MGRLFDEPCCYVEGRLKIFGMGVWHELGEAGFGKFRYLRCTGIAWAFDDGNGLVIDVPAFERWSLGDEGGRNKESNYYQ